MARTIEAMPPILDESDGRSPIASTKDVATISPNDGDSSNNQAPVPPARNVDLTVNTDVAACTTGQAQADETVAAADSISNETPPPPPPLSMPNHNHNDMTATMTIANKTKNADALSKSEAVQRARSHWKFVRSIVVLSQRKKSSSLTTAEATFLNMITKSRLEVDHDIVRGRGGHCEQNASSPNMARFKHSRRSSVGIMSDDDDDDDDDDAPAPPNNAVDQLGVSVRTHFSHLVQAAMAKERLRDSISARLVDLSTAETKFLTKLVANRHVTLQALQNAVHVLNNDPLYNPKLRRKGEREENEYQSGSDEMNGEIAQEEEANGNDDIANYHERTIPDNNDISNQEVISPRRASAITSSVLFDKVLVEVDASVRSTTVQGVEEEIDMSAKKDANMRRKSAIDQSMHRRRVIRRRAGVAESSIWNLARGAAANNKDEMRDDDSPPLLIGLAPGGHILNESVRNTMHGNMLDSSIHRTPRGSISKRGEGSVGGRGSGDFLSASTRTRRIPAAATTGNILSASVRTRGRPGGGINSSSRRYQRMGSGENGLDASTRRRRATPDATARTHRRIGSGSDKGKTQLRRGSSLGSGALDASERNRRGSKTRANSGSGNALLLDGSTRSIRHRTSTEEKSLWKLMNGESMEEVGDDDDSVLEDEDMNLHVMSVTAGEAIDPLLMACPAEMTPLRSNRKTLELGGGHAGDFLSQSVRLRGRNTMMKEGDVLSQSVRTGSGRGAGSAIGLGSQRRRGSTGANPLHLSNPPVTGNEKKMTGLDQLLWSSSEYSNRGHARMPPLQETLPMPAVLETYHSDELEHGEELSEQGSGKTDEQENLDYVSVVESEASKEALNLLACCGIEGMSFMENMMDLDATTVDGENEKSPGIDDKVDDMDSLTCKKQYLRLNHHDTDVENERQNHLSTWMGAPEDYPILGLGKKRTTPDDDVDYDWEEGSEGSFDDPLEPHVLSPLLMKCLRDHLPYALQEENFWLRYSLVRDGASLDTIFDTTRHSQRTVLAIETSHGEVLGSFTSSPWRSNGNQYYGSCEAFVWMLRKSRRNDKGEENCHTLDEYILRESSLEVFPWNAKEGNRNVQLSDRRKLFVGGGDPDPEVDDYGMHNGSGGGRERDDNDSNSQWGMALALDKDLLRGTSSRCATFGSNPLIDKSRHEGSEVFEIMNMEIWALTPCVNEEMAEELELGRTFVMGFHQ